MRMYETKGTYDRGVEPVLAAVVPHLAPIAGHPAHQTRAKITSGVERIAKRMSDQ